jgi:hypothetical protein
LDRTLAAEAFPVGWFYIGEGVDNGGIELNATEFKYFLECVLILSATSINPIGCDRVESVGNSEDACAQADLITL